MRRSTGGSQGSVPLHLGRVRTRGTYSSIQPRTLEAIERAYILKILRQVNGNKSEAAKILGITRQTLRKKLTEAPPAS